MGNPDFTLRLLQGSQVSKYHLLPDALALNGPRQLLFRAPQEGELEGASGGGGELLDLRLPTADNSSGTVDSRRFELDPAKYQASLIKKRNGKILLGTGGAVLVAGLGLLLAGALKDRNLSESGLGITGVTATGLSVPLLIAGTVHLIQGNNLVR